MHCPLDDAEIAPLGKGSCAVQLEDITSGEGAIVIEVVENAGVDGDEFLQTSHSSEALYGPLTSSEWKM